MWGGLMFVVSVKSSAIKSVLLCLLLAGCAALGVYAAHRSISAAGKADNAAVSYRASNAAERAEFLSQFGWEAGEDPLEVAEVLIPAEFDKAYEEYNSIQKQHGLDLSDYSGKRVKRWTYEIKNYPGYESSGLVQANLFVADGQVVGGDICSLEKNGFIQCFYFPDSGTTEESSVKDVEATT